MSETTLLPAPEYQTPHRDDQWERERLAFLGMQPTLLQTYCGKHVAIHDGEVVDCDTDEVQLGLRVYGKYGYIPIYVGLVTKTPAPIVRVASPRLRQTAAHE